MQRNDIIDNSTKAVGGSIIYISRNDTRWKSTSHREKESRRMKL